MRFEVWAPNATSVELALADHRVGMIAEEDGWWASEVANAGPGTDYAFSLDGGPPRPDPRSAWQPAGVEGPSRVVDHAAFSWSDAGWHGVHLPAAVVYELHVGTFTPEGTFASAIGKLDHLVELGVTLVEVMPVAAFPGQHGWGYDGVGLWAVHDPYGGPDGFKGFVDACHGRGLGVALDVVYNHPGPRGNYLDEFGPYFTDRYRTPWGPAVNVDGPGSDDVRGFIVDNALMWLTDYHLDGLRLDATHAIIDVTATHILEEVTLEVERLAAHLGRPLWVIAENDRNDPRVVRAREAGGLGVHAQWNDDFHHALHVALTGEQDGYYEDYTSADLCTALEQGFVYAGQAFSAYRGRYYGRTLGDVPLWRLVGYGQNHDQTGNRARGERLAQLVSPGRVKVAAALVLTAPFVPMLFQGEEWGSRTPFLYFCDHSDAELAARIAEGRREEFAAFGWRADDVPDPNAYETYAASQLDWHDLDRPAHRETLEWYQSLVALRQSRRELTDGRAADVVLHDSGVLEVWRGLIGVVANLAEGDRAVEVPGAELLLTSARGCELRDRKLWLPASTVAIIEAR